jgi:hypothetical protein
MQREERDVTTSDRDGRASAWGRLGIVPRRAPPWLERLAGVCLRADAEDSRLGDLSEQYVRSHECARHRFDSAPWATAAAHGAAGLGYLATTANVMLFARTVDPSPRLAENDAAALIALELRERTMATLRIAIRRVALPALLLVCSALLLNSAFETWHSWKQTEALMVRLQRDKAEAATGNINAFLRTVESQIGWVTYAKFGELLTDQRRFDYVRLLRQVPAITELRQLDGEGREQLAVSRLAMDVVDSGADRSADPAFVETKVKPIYFSPVYLRKKSEPYMTIAISHGARRGVTVAEVNLKPVWDAIRSIKVGDRGYAYIVDGKGRLIAHPDFSVALRQPDLSAVPQVASALADPTSDKSFDGRTFGDVASGGRSEAILSVHVQVPQVGWQVLVDVPAAEMRAPFWGVIMRAASLVGLGLMTGILAILIATRPIRIERPLAAA